MVFLRAARRVTDEQIGLRIRHMKANRRCRAAREPVPLLDKRAVS
jgi:hypothetical protein